MKVLPVVTETYLKEWKTYAVEKVLPNNQLIKQHTLVVVVVIWMNINTCFTSDIFIQIVSASISYS